MRTILTHILFAAVLVFPLTGAAQAPPEEVRQIFGEAGFGRIDEDHFVTLRAGFYLLKDVRAVGCTAQEADACRTLLEATLQAPLRFRVIDEEPADDTVLRVEDWDAPSDFMRVVRFVEYGRPTDAVHGRFGELGSVVLGHGTVMNGYFNVVTPDAYQAGVHTNINTSYGGLQLVLDDVLQPAVFGMRGYARPWAWIDPDSWLHRVAIGVSAVSDMKAPTELVRDDEGNVVVGPRQAPQTEQTQAFTMGGVDVEVSAVEGEQFRLLPYVDFNYGLGPGLHAGTTAAAALGGEVSLAARLEYRLVGPRYLPDYFGPIYEVGRFSYTGWEQLVPAPKLRVAASRNGSASGAYGALTGRFSDVVALSAALADYQGLRNTSAWLRADVTPPGPFALGLFYYKQNMESLDQLASLDGALAAAEARLAIWGPLYAHADYERLWRLHSDGQYETIDAWNAGIGAAYRW